jgi:hypothetical protein
MLLLHRVCAFASTLFSSLEFSIDPLACSDFLSLRTAKQRVRSMPNGRAEHCTCQKVASVVMLLGADICGGDSCFTAADASFDEERSLLLFLLPLPRGQFSQ